MALVTSLRDAVWLAIGIAAVALLFQTLFERIPRGAPVTVHRVEAVQPRVPRGGTLLLRIHVTKHRLECAVNANRFLASGSGELWLLPAVAEVPLLEVGERRLLVALPVPARIEPGRYRYFSTTEYVCPDGRYVVRTEPAPFEIVPAADGEEPS